MTAEWLVGLAASGGGALVGAVVTDVWQAARSGYARLFSRGDGPRGELVEARLDALAAEVRRAGPADRDAVCGRLALAWQTRLIDLLEEHPDAADELRDLVATLRDGVPGIREAWTQTNVARDRSTQYVVQRGTIEIHGPGPVEGR